MKIALWITGGILLIIGLVLGIIIWLFQRDLNKEDPEYILEFVQQHKDDPNVSLSIRHNQQSLAAINENEKLPLASTVKIIIAIEYARQASEGIIDADKSVSLKELERYYIPKTDGGSHEAWLEEVKQKTDTDNVPLSEVAKGMIDYSSNANTDYLIHLLGLENINQQFKKLGVSQHDSLYPIVSAMFIPSHLMEERKLTKKETKEALKNMDISEYRNLSMDIHKKWLSHPPTDQEKKQLLKTMSMDLQRIWSDRLPGSTTADYISIMDKLNSKTFFDKQLYTYLDPVMEQIMTNPRNQEWLKHAGQKGGSTAFVFTIAMYATDKKGNTTGLAFFNNNLEPREQAKLSRNFNAFLLKALTDEEFRARVKEELADY